MQRREFIAGLGSAAARPVMARAQQPDKVRRIGVIMGFSVQNSEAARRVAAFERKLTELGRKDGIDLQIEYRWPGNPPDRLRADIAEIARPSTIVTFLQYSRETNRGDNGPPCAAHDLPTLAA
jgi:putative ABC transport system substrate-binding protein